MTFNTPEEAVKAAEQMSQRKLGRDEDMNNRARIATNLAQTFAPGRKLVMVRTEDEMRAATEQEFEAEGSKFDKDQYKPNTPGLVTQKGTLVINLGAATGTEDLLHTITHETGHSAFTQAGLTAMMQGKGVEQLASELYKGGLIRDTFNENGTMVDGKKQFVEAVKRYKLAAAQPRADAFVDSLVSKDLVGKAQKTKVLAAVKAALTKAEETEAARVAEAVKAGKSAIDASVGGKERISAALIDSLQKDGHLPAGIPARTTALTLYKGSGLQLTDAGAAEEVLANMNQGIDPVRGRSSATA